MKLVNTTDPNSPFYVGKCKNNTPPKHVTITEGENAAESKEITIISKADGKDVTTKGTMYKSKKSAEYIYLKVGENWLWIKDSTAFDQTTFHEVEKVEKAKPEPKAKDGKKDGAAPTLEAGKNYSVNGTVMTGATANKRLGAKNVANSIQKGQVFEVDEEGNQVGGILGQEAPAAEAEANAAGDTGAA